MKYYLFIDETGDHSLSNIDIRFPIFMIGAVLISEKEYFIFQKKINNFKIKFFKTKEIILHSRDIRKINPPFEILFNLKVKEEFYKELNNIIIETDFVINPVAIMKKNHIEKYGKFAKNPYGLSLNFLMERAIFDCENIINCSELEVIIEQRGRKEDAELLKVYQSVIANGTSFVESYRFEKIFTGIDFKNKMDNDEGLQLSDLISYPVARKILNPEKINTAYDIVEGKIRKKGWKIFP